MDGPWDLKQPISITALLITNLVGFPAAIAFGWMGGKIGALRGIYIALAVYVAVTIFAYGMDNVSEFYILAVVVGLVQGGNPSSQSFLFRLYYSQRQIC